MSTIQETVTSLTDATTTLLEAVNVKKSTLDQGVASATNSASSAASSASAAEASAGQSAGSVAQALAIYGTTNAFATALGTAQNQVSLAAGYAASAGSVAQQDLSGVASAALHRSPNAVTAMFIYDTSKDSDGGAWRKRMGHTSWMNEPLAGAYLGSKATLAAAWATTGAAAGNYFQLTSDGKFYALAGTSTSVETFRGNKAEFPALSSIVAEAGSVTIYDLTAPGNPMWMRFTYLGAMGWSFGSSELSSQVSVAMLNGKIFIGRSFASVNNGGLIVSFANDDMQCVFTTSLTLTTGRLIAQRNAARLFATAGSGVVIPNAFINAVAMTVLPDAPVDSVTGLQIPTIAVGTNNGLSVIKSDGSVVNISNTFYSNFISISFDVRGGISCVQITSSPIFSIYAHYPNIPASNLSITTTSFGVSGSYSVTGLLVQPQGSGNQNIKTVQASRTSALSSDIGLNLMKENISTPSSSLLARLSNTYNTGYLVGDIRRAWLADNSVGSITASELVTNGTFDTDTTGWIAGPTNAGGETFTANNGQAVLTPTTLGYSRFRAPVTCVVGRSYKITGSFISGPGAILFDTNGNGGILASGGTGTSFSFVSVATSTNMFISLVANGSTTSPVTFDNISIKEALPDRSYKAKLLSILGTLTKSQVAIAAQLVAFSGFSAVNYLRETEWSSDLDFGTGSFSVSSWVNVPAMLPVSSFPSTHLTAGDRFNTTDWTKGTGWVATSDTVLTCDGTQTSSSDCRCSVLLTPASHLFNRWTITVTAISGSLLIYDNNGGPLFISAPGTYYSTARGGYSSTSIFRMTAGQTCTLSLSVEQLSPASIVNRSAETGSSLQLGLSYQGVISTSIFDGTTTQTVTSPAAYNNGSWVHARAEYSAGALKLKINGIQVAQAAGAALLTLSNSLAVATVGNNFALNAPFPGSLALVKVSATIPTDEQSVWMYEQEKQMFRDGVQCCLPDSNAINDLAYDELLDKWTAVSSTNESSFTGLVRTSTAPVSAGAISKVSTQSGVKLLARTTTSPGVDITIPAQGLREELVRRSEAAAAQSKTLTVFDFDSVGFTASTTSGSALITAVASVVGTPAIGMGITGAGIPASTTIIAINGTTYTLSANATATATLVVLGQNTFDLPLGFTATEVLSAGASKREGTTRDWVRIFDGFKETIRFGVSPGSAAWVQITSKKA